jgi:hypothetical protein
MQALQHKDSLTAGCQGGWPPERSILHLKKKKINLKGEMTGIANNGHGNMATLFSLNPWTSFVSDQKDQTMRHYEMVGHHHRDF